MIDGVDISTIGLETLRSSLAIIPQDPVLYSGTVRSNLDPFGLYDVQEIWRSLDVALLKSTIEALEGQLDAPVAEDGANFSVGQRAQFCLARAMLRHAKILILDEATASIDSGTDDNIQRGLRQHFTGTILTIAHRLNTIVDYDRILVLDHGQVREFDTPTNLLRDTSTIFYSLVQQTGDSSAQLLHQIAYEKEEKDRREGKSFERNVIRTGQKQNASAYQKFDIDEPSQVRWNGSLE